MDLHPKYAVRRLFFAQIIHGRGQPTGQNTTGVERIDGKEEPVSINLVPYYTWANRGNKSMAVWIPQGPVKLADPLKWIPATGAKPPRSKYGADAEVIFEN